MAKYTDEQIKMFDSKEDYYQYIINRQEAEIERLRDERQYLRSKLGLMHDMTYITHKQVCEDDFLVYSKEANGCEKLLNSAKSEAIKEYIELLKAEFLKDYKGNDDFTYFVFGYIDKVAEMVGEGE